MIAIVSGPKKIFIVPVHVAFPQSVGDLFYFFQFTTLTKDPTEYCLLSTWSTCGRLQEYLPCIQDHYHHYKVINLTSVNHSQLQHIKNKVIIQV